MDFVTICYNNTLDIKMLELQAVSFKYVNLNLCNNILIFFNANNASENDVFKEYAMNTLIYSYPEYFQSRVFVFTKIDFNLDCKNNWQTQQLLKLIISTKIKTEYYIVLDTKNHFINNTEKADFFTNNKPNMYYNFKSHLNDKLFSSLILFDVENPARKIIDLEKYEFSTITPFILKKEYVYNLINFFPNFNNFFLFNNTITEFFLYTSFLIKINKIHEYNIINKNQNKLYYTYFKTRMSFDININYKILAIHHSAIENIEPDFIKKYNETDLYEIVQNLLEIKNPRDKIFVL